MHAVPLPRSPQDKPAEIRISVAVGAALLVQTALALIWTGAASERLAQLERRADQQAVVLERTARLEEQVRFVSETLIRIEKKIDAQDGEGAP